MVINSMGKFVFLGFPLATDIPRPPAIPALKLSPFLSLENGDEANVTNIDLVSHIGTHVDAPCHVIKDGITLTDFEAEEFVFYSPLLIDLSLGDGEIVQAHHLEPFVEQGKEADLLLFRFGSGEIRRSDPQRYSTKSPGFGVESAEYLLKNFPAMRAVGMDVPSLSCIEYLDKTMFAHNVLLGGKNRHFMVIEDMDLEQDLSKLAMVILAPLMVKGIDGAPCTILGWIDQAKKEK